MPAFRQPERREAGRQECPPHLRNVFVTVWRRYDRNISPMAIAMHVILSGAKNLPSSRLDVRRKPSLTHMRGGMVSLAPAQPDRVGANVPPANSPRMTEHARVSSDAAVDPSSASLPMNRRQAGRLPQDDMIGNQPACHSERHRRLPNNAWSLPVLLALSLSKRLAEVSMPALSSVPELVEGCRNVEMPALRQPQRRATLNALDII